MPAAPGLSLDKYMKKYAADPNDENKKAAEEAPTILGEAVAKADALKMKQVLEEAGAKVELS